MSNDFYPGGCCASIQEGKIDPLQPVWGKMGEWTLYKNDEVGALKKELEETKKKLADAQAELSRRDAQHWDGSKGNLMAHGLKACADVTFTPKAPEDFSGNELQNG